MKKKFLLSLAGLVFWILGSIGGGSLKAQSVLATFNEIGGGASSPTIMQANDGNFYGTAPGNATFPNVTPPQIYKLTPSGTLTTLAYLNTSGQPSGLIQASDGNLYGTTPQTIYRLTLSGTLTTVATYSGFGGFSGFSFPLIQGSDGNLYGIGTQLDSTNVSHGTIYRLTLSGSLTTLATFSATVNNSYPTSLMEASDGNFYGTTSTTVFKMTPTGTLTTLVSFSMNDGQNLNGPLLEGSDGNLYGSAKSGGTGSAGTVFRVTPTGQLTILWSFPSQLPAPDPGVFIYYNPNDPGAGGYYSNPPSVLEGPGSPTGPMVQDGNGNLYGTGLDGGLWQVGTVQGQPALVSSPGGSVFEITNYTSASYATQVVTNFPSSDSYLGVNPEEGLIVGSDGNLYGTTSTAFRSGAYESGAAFEIQIQPDVPVQPAQTVNLAAGQPFSLQLSNFGLSGPFGNEIALPSWITFNALNGVLTGTAPSELVTSVVTVRATGYNSSGQQVELPLQINLVSPWMDADIGSPSLSGGSTPLNAQDTSFTVSGAGSDIWNRSDSFHYLFQPVTGDFMIVTEVTAQTPTDPWAKAGLMVRNDPADPGSINALVAITPGHGVTFQYRDCEAGDSKFTNLRGEVIPQWLALERQGSLIAGYVSADGLNWTQVGAVYLTNLNATADLGLAVTSHNSAKLSTATFSDINLNTNFQPPPAPLQQTDIGLSATDLPGYAWTTTGSTNLMVAGAGHDIWNRADAFHYVYESVTGDFSLVTQVFGQTNTDPWAKAGLMIRNDPTDPGAVNALVAVTPGNGVTFQYRMVEGGVSNYNNLPGLEVPQWLKLTRTGSVITGYRSVDGVNWTKVGQQTLGSLSSSVVVGLAVTSHNAAALSLASFANFGLTLPSQ